MATSLADILASLQNGVVAIRSVATSLSNVFPQATATSSIAPAAGTLTFSSSQPSIFISVLTSSGGIYKIPGYPS